MRARRALAAVLLYRLVSFWLAVLAGWLILIWLRHPWRRRRRRGTGHSHEYTVSPDGKLVFATMSGDYIQADGSRPYTNVYVFRFAISDGKIQRVDEYANPVTFARLAGIPIG
jgi:hypothetical protein